MNNNRKTNKKILLIGGQGYVGSGLYNELRKYHTIHYTGRERKNLSLDDPNFRILDYNKPETIKKVLTNESYDLIVFLAAEIKINSNKEIDLKDPMFKTNTFLFNELMKNTTEVQKNAKLIYISSMTVYNKDLESPIKENYSLNPPNTYGLSKLFAEKLFCFHLNNLPENNNNKGMIIRIPGIFGGKRKTGYIFDTITKLKNNQDIIIDSSNLIYWETIEINDFTEMFKELIEKYEFNKKVDIFNICYGEEIDFINTSFMLKDIINSKSEIKIIKKDYRKFFLSDNKISKYIKNKKERYSYTSTLKKVVEEMK
jgi:nucleoside-diphosphate-sugar epimerase